MNISFFLIYFAFTLGVTVFVAVLYQLIGFIISLNLKRNDIADVMWGRGFVVVSYFWLIIVSTPVSFSAKIALFCISLWGIRLTLHILQRFVSHKEEDRRYAKWRSEWTYVKTRSFFQVFILQGVLMALVLIPFIIHIGTGVTTPLWLVVIGFLLWCLGFFFQITGDIQLKNFLQTRKKSEVLMTKGVWSLTRHPNYFGEVTMWWGVFLICLTTFSPVYVLFTLVGPLVITGLIVFVSGVPLIENHWKEKYPKEFEKYAKNTPVLVPTPRSVFTPVYEYFKPSKKN